MFTNLLPDRSKFFLITFPWKDETKTVPIMVTFCKNGNVIVSPLKDQWLARRGNPLNWATWDVQNAFRNTYRKGDPLPSDQDFYDKIIQVGLDKGVEAEILMSIDLAEPDNQNNSQDS